MNPDHEKNQDLMARYLAGVADADEVRLLETRMSTDAALRRDFLSHANVDATLLASVQPAAIEATREKPKPTRWSGGVARLAAAAAVVAVSWSAFWWNTGGVKVDVLAISGSKASSWSIGSTRRLRDLALADGAAQLRLANGVVLDLVAPVHLRFVDDMHARVLAGSVTADVGPAGSGFTLDTPSARVVDLGTRFGVSVLDDGDTDVAVFQGKVEVHEPKGTTQKQSVLTLKAGDSVRVSSQALVRRQALIATRGESAFVLEPPPPDALVTGVSDNIEDDGFRSFYTIQRGAMKPGVRPYSTLGRPRWQAMPGTEFPAGLLGADVIGTFSADRHERDLQLDVNVSHACTVYVMLDTRGEVPNWVRRDFIDTGLRLRSGPWAGNPVVQGMTTDANGEIHVEYVVWKKAVPTAGTITLGPPYPVGEATHRAMYGVAVK
ncbi:FecR domain-containing protein [Prosthecobacter sp.]|uniref:FecR domain-containing protein n=1 Tax=Prosthecobacter sp. TaxID=1965333 RepID=UPI001DF04C6C|nr:FecR domain-containing protein [Prosthecobacter sp.]MCB1276751.1 FecR domain-containing protein [Prosthecobacter sp.]